MRAHRNPGWLSLDVVSVLLFCAAGRRSHDEGVDISGVAATAWPFLAGTALGWLLSRAWRRPAALAPTGIIVWLSTVIAGMLLRKASAAGVAASFVLVATSVTAVLLLGWRVVAGLAARRGADS
jgi:hypothetical protein